MKINTGGIRSFEPSSSPSFVRRLAFPGSGPIPRGGPFHQKNKTTDKTQTLVNLIRAVQLKVYNTLSFGVRWDS